MDIWSAFGVVLHIGDKFGFDFLHVIVVQHAVLGQNVHQLEEVLLDLNCLLISRVKECDHVRFLVVCAGHHIQSFLEDLLKDEVANDCLFLHVFFDELDEELVDLNLEVGRDLTNVNWSDLVDDLFQRRTLDYHIFCLCVEADDLAQDNDHEEVHLLREDFGADSWAMQDLEQ